jgi:hypothetical protein
MGAAKDVTMKIVWPVVFAVAVAGVAYLQLKGSFGGQ